MGVALAILALVAITLLAVDVFLVTSTVHMPRRPVTWPIAAFHVAYIGLTIGLLIYAYRGFRL